MVVFSVYCLMDLLFDIRGAEKSDYLKSIGADHVIDSSKDNVIESAKSFLKARGLKFVDVLYDSD